MNAFIALYTTTSGRISRKSWWLGVLGLIVVGIVLSLLLGLVGLGISPMAPSFDPANPQMVAELMRKSAWGSLVSFVVLAYPIYCLSIKRRQDRDDNGLDLKIYMGLTLLLLVVQAAGVGLAMTDFGGGVMVPMPSAWLGIAGLAVGILAIYLLVVLGFLRGTVGNNSYGADPAGGEWAAAE